MSSTVYNDSGLNPAVAAQVKAAAQNAVKAKVITAAEQTPPLTPDTVSIQGQSQTQPSRGFFARLINGAINTVSTFASNFASSVSGLFSSADQTTAEVTEALESGQVETAMDKIKAFLAGNLPTLDPAVIESMTPEELLKSYDLALETMQTSATKVLDRTETFAQGLKGNERASLLIVMISPRLTDAQKVKALDTGTAAVKTMVTVATPQDLSDRANIELMAKIEANDQTIANSIQDAGTRATALAKLNDFNTEMAKAITDKVGPTADSESAQVFIANVAACKIKGIECKMTEEVVAMLISNRDEQNKMDENVLLANLAESQREEKETKKNEEVTHDVQVQDLRGLQRRLAREQMALRAMLNSGPTAQKVKEEAQRLQRKADSQANDAKST